MEIAYDQLLLLVLQCLIIALLLASLFRLRSIFGLSLLYITLGVFQFLQVFLASSLLIEISSGIFISSGSTVLFSASLFMVLLIYIREDALETRKIIYALLAANLITALLLVLFGWSIDNDVVTNFYNLPSEFFSANARILFAGTTIFLLDAFALIFIYEFISKYVKSLFLRILCTMCLVLSLDSILFAFGIFYDKLEFQNILISGLISKNLAAVIYSSLFALYLVYFDSILIKSETEADTFKDIFHKLTFRQKYDDVFTEMKNKSIQLEQAQEIAQLGTFNLDLTTMLFSSSPIFDAIFGFNLEKTKEFTTYQKIVHPDDLPENKILLANCIKTGKKFDREYRIFSKNTKQLKWVHSMGEVIYLEGEPAFFKGTTQDITKQKLVEKKLQESEDRFQRFANSSFEGIGIHVDGIIQDVNKHLSVMSGYSREELIGKPYMMIVHPDDLEMIADYIKKGYDEALEFRILKKDGNVVYVEGRGAHISYNGKNARISNFYDISDRIKIKNKLLKSEDKFFKTYYNNPIPISISTIPDGKFIDINPTFEKFLGYTREEITGKTGIELGFYVNPEDREILFVQFASKGKLDGGEIKLKTKKGEIKDCLVYAEVIEINNELCLLTIVHDITKQLKAQKEILEKNTTLEKISSSLSEKNILLYESERKFKDLFDKNPVSLWEEDFSVVKKLLNKKLKETSDLKQYLNENPDFVVECISKLEILNVNDFTLELLGFKNKKELLASLSKTFNEISFEGFKKQLLAVAQNKKEFSSESELVRSDGKIINVLIKFVNISVDDGTAIVSIVDISELNKAKEKIIDSEIKFKNLFEKSPVSLWEEDFSTVKHLLDKKMTETSDLKQYLDNNPDFVFECVSKVEILNVNNITLELFGVNNTEELINHLSKTFNDKSIEIFKEELLALALNKKEFSGETEFIRKDGRIINALIKFLIIDDNYENAIVSIVDITSRKQAELKLVESEHELQNSQEIAQLGTFNLDFATMRFSSSPIYDAILGFNLEKTKKMTTYQKIVHPDDLPENKIMLANCIKTGKKFDREFRIFNKKTKKLTWIHGLGEIINIDGEPSFFKGTVQDITARKLIDLDVKINEQKLIDIQKIANLGTYELDLVTNSISTSSIYKSILGLKKRPKNNKGWWKSITHPDDYERSEQLWQQSIKDCTFFNDEYRIITDKNEIKWIHDIAEVKCENGIAVKVVGTIQDITKRKLSEEKIKRSDSILSQVNSLVQVIDKHKNITYASPSFKTILGFEPDDMLGQGWWIKTTSSLAEATKLRDAIINGVNSDTSIPDELKYRWIKAENGQLKLFDWISSKGEDGSFIFIGIDVTEKQEQEEQFKTLTETAHEAIILVDHNGLIFEWNKASEETFGYLKKEIIGKSIITLMPKRYRSYYNKGFNEVMQKGLKESYRNNMVEGLTKENVIFPMELSLNFWETNNNYVYAYFIKDVTQRVREENIKQVLFNIAKKSNESISLEKLFSFIKIELGKLINTNNFFITVYDEKKDMLITPYMVDEIDVILDFPKGKTLTGHVIDTKNALLTKDVIINTSSKNKEAIGLGPESKCWLGVPILIDDKAIGAIVVQSYTDENAYNEDDVILLELVASNIGPIIRKTRDLEQIKLLNQALIHTPAIVMITNNKGELEFVNSSFTKALGYEPDDVIGKNPKFLNTEIKLKKFYSVVGKSIGKKGYWQDEIVNIKKNGDLIRVSASVAPVKDENNNVSHYIIVEEDITEKRKLERQFINAIIEAQDIEKQNFGEELHDGISQILSAESMYIDLLIDQNQDRIKNKAKFLTKIKELNSSAINETRNIAHGLMSSQLKQSGLLISVENICIDFSNNKNIEFKFVNDGVVEKELSQEIKTNLFRILQELSTNINRYSNATKAMISFSKLNENRLEIIVKDNGIGMDYNRIKNEATGIGLQTVKRRVTYLNGKFDLETALNEGTCYTLEIPLI